VYLLPWLFWFVGTDSWQCWQGRGRLDRFHVDDDVRRARIGNGRGLCSSLIKNLLKAFCGKANLS
jgi:hypothetical protein